MRIWSKFEKDEDKTEHSWEDVEDIAILKRKEEKEVKGNYENNEKM